MIINIALLGARLGDASQTNWAWFSATNRILAFVALVVGSTFFIKNIPPKFNMHRFIFLVILAFLIRIFSIISAPNPTIDVFYILRDGPKQLLLGENPYELNYPAPYGVYIPTIIFVYGPLTPFIFLPSVIIFNDPRYTLIAADLISLFVLFKLSKLLKIPGQFTLLLSLIFFYHPLFPFMTEQAWLEPVITMLIFSAAFVLIKRPKSFIGGLFLGGVLSVKSVYILPVFVFLKNMKARLSSFVAAIIVLTIFTLPFLLINGPLFFERTQTYVTSPEAIDRYLAPTSVSLSIAAVILKYTGVVIPTIVVMLIGLSTSLIAIIFRKNDYYFASLSLFLVFISLFMFGPFVFLQYFAFLGNLLILTILLLLAKSPNEKR